jgi:hypothetical protein
MTGMSTAIQILLRLADEMAAHENVTHWAISMRLSNKGDFLQRLRNGGDCSTRTYEKVLTRASTIWPADLEWPRDIPRPKKREAA